MSEPTKQLAFSVNQELLDIIEGLKKELGVKTTAAVFRKALAVTKLAAEQSRDSGGIVDIKAYGSEDGKGISVALKT